MSSSGIDENALATTMIESFDLDFTLPELVHLWLSNVIKRILNEIILRNLSREGMDSAYARIKYIADNEREKFTPKSKNPDEVAASIIRAVSNMPIPSRAGSPRSRILEALTNERVPKENICTLLEKSQNILAEAAFIVMIQTLKLDFIAELDYADIDDYIAEFEKETLQRGQPMFQQCLESMENLAKTATIMKICALFIPVTRSKGRFMDISSAIVERKRYVTGGGNCVASQRREVMFRVISGVKPTPKNPERRLQELAAITTSPKLSGGFFKRNLSNPVDDEECSPPAGNQSRKRYQCKSSDSYDEFAPTAVAPTAAAAVYVTPHSSPCSSASASAHHSSASSPTHTLHADAVPELDLLWSSNGNKLSIADILEVGDDDYVEPSQPKPPVQTFSDMLKCSGFNVGYIDNNMPIHPSLFDKPPTGGEAPPLFPIMSAAMPPPAAIVAEDYGDNVISLSSNSIPIRVINTPSVAIQPSSSSSSNVSNHMVISSSVQSTVEANPEPSNPTPMIMTTASIGSSDDNITPSAAPANLLMNHMVISSSIFDDDKVPEPGNPVPLMNCISDLIDDEQLQSLLSQVSFEDNLERVNM